MVRPVFILLVLALLPVLPAIAQTSEHFIAGKCADGSNAAAWWKVIEVDAHGNTVCMTERHCNGIVASDCPSGGEESEFKGLVSRTATGPVFRNGTGDTLWIVEERLPNTELVCRTWAMAGHYVYTSCNPIDLRLIVPVPDPIPEVNLDLLDEDPDMQQENELPELSRDRGGEDDDTTTRTAGTEPDIRK